MQDPSVQEPFLLTFLRQQLLRQQPWPPLLPSGTVPGPQLPVSSSPCVYAQAAWLTDTAHVTVEKPVCVCNIVHDVTTHDVTVHIMCAGPVCDT